MPFEMVCRGSDGCSLWGTWAPRPSILPRVPHRPRSLMWMMFLGPRVLVHRHFRPRLSLHQLPQNNRPCLLQRLLHLLMPKGSLLCPASMRPKTGIRLRPVLSDLRLKEGHRATFTSQSNVPRRRGYLGVLLDHLLCYSASFLMNRTVRGTPGQAGI